jgi:predicted DCC family thiol-disulfide oxidoreductase YuxK
MPQVPYSYRADPAVPRFDDSHPVVIFDGLCVLCSAGAQWMRARDPHGTSRFAAIQSPVPRALYHHYGLDPDRFHTFMVLSGGVAHVKWLGLLAAARTMPAPWWWLGEAGRIVPSSVGDILYDWVQRNRLAWFGRRAVCLAPGEIGAGRALPG